MPADPLAATSLTEALLCAATEYAELPAIDDGRQCLSYSDLVERAAALASGIDKLAGPLVGLSAHRDLETYLLYVAVLFSGRTVVPIDPSAPRRIIAAAEVDLVVTSKAADRERFAHGLVLIDELPDGGSRMAAAELAYVLHTSGSTGTPKGVPITHQNVLAYLREVVPRYRPGPGARCSATFQLTFDPSVHDMFVTWLTGATLVLPRGREASLPVTYVQQRQLTHWFSVPAAIRLASRLNQLEPGSLPGLRSSLFCGEQLLLSDAALWQAAAPQAPLENLYGPTELTVTCISYRLPSDPSAWPVTTNGTVPIGQPYDGLEHRINPAGELLIRGPQRFNGYLGGKPLADDDWYRTGDLVQQKAEGLVHLGRTDDQVQLGGHRVEPAEVAATIRRFPGVTDAVVLADGEHLAAAVLGSAEPAELRAELRRELPAYLCPDHVQAFDAFPLNAHGKVDLPVLREQLAAAFGLCRIWSEVLGTPVAPEDNFYDLGGDSLQALTIAADARGFGLDLDAGDVLEAQTPGLLAGRARPIIPPVEQAASQVARFGRGIRRVGSVRVPLLPAQARFLSRGFERPEENTVSAWFDVPTKLDVPAWQRISESLAETDDAFRVSFRDGEQLADPDVRPLYERVAYGPAARDHETLEQIAVKVRTGAGLDDRPLLTLHHADLGAGEGRLLVSAHHLIMDAVSWSHLVKRLENLYAGRAPRGRSGSVPMSRWADAVAEYVAGDRQREVDRWAALPWSEVAGLPLADEEVLFAAEQSEVLPADLVQRLHRLGQREARARIVGALAVALSRWSGDGGALLDVVVHGRDGLRLGLDLSETIGWLATDTPVVLRPEECRDAETAARSARRQLAIGGDAEFSALRFLGESAAVTQLPQPQVVVNIRNDRATASGAFRPTDAPIGPFAVERNPYAVRLAVDLQEKHGRLRWRYHRAAAMAVHDTLSSTFLSTLKEEVR